MTTLLDQINQRLASPGTAQISKQPSMAGLAAAKGGKATTATAAPAATTLTTQAVQQQGQTAIRQAQAGAQQTAAGLQAGAEAQAQEAQQQQAAQAQQQQLADQQRQAREQQARMQIRAREEEVQVKLDAKEQSAINQINHAFRQQLEQLTAERGLTIDNLFSDLRRSDKELEFRRDAAQLEQRGFLLALQDSQYAAEIERIGKRRQLMNEFEYEEDALRVRLGDDMVDFLDEIGFRRGFNADQREFDVRMQQLTIDEAERIFIADAKAAAKRQMWQGIGSMVTSAVGIGGKMGGGDKPKEVEVDAVDSSTRYSSGGNTTYETNRINDTDIA